MCDKVNENCWQMYAALVHKLIYLGAGVRDVCSHRAYIELITAWGDHVCNGSGSYDATRNTWPSSTRQIMLDHSLDGSTFVFYIPHFY